MSARILVVDDEPRAEDSVAEVLSACGLVPVVAQSYDEAMQHIAEQTFDGAVIDLVLEGQAVGHLLVRALVERCPDARIVLVTGRRSLDACRAAFAAGGKLLTKPYDPFSLVPFFVGDSAVPIPFSASAQEAARAMAIKDSLCRSDGNVASTARELEISRPTVRRCRDREAPDDDDSDPQ